MDPQTVAIGLMLAREIIQTYNLQKQISEDELTKLITNNLTKINLVIETIEREMRGE